MRAVGVLVGNGLRRRAALAGLALVVTLGMGTALAVAVAVALVNSVIPARAAIRSASTYEQRDV